MVFTNKRNSKAYESVKTALETLEKIEFCFEKILKEFDEGTSAPPSQVCAENGIVYSRLKILLKSYAFNNIYTHGLIKPSNLELPEMDPYEKLYREVFQIKDNIPAEFPVDLIQTVDWILDNVLNKQQREVIILRFGFSEDDGFLTYEETGKSIGISGERVRQIEAKAIRQLRYPEKSKLLRDGMIKTKELEAIKEMTLKRAKEESEKRLRESEKDVENKNYNIDGVDIPDLIIALKQRSISELDLTVRAFNALLGHNIRNIYDLVVIENYEFRRRIRNLGKVSQKEVIEKLNQYLNKFGTTRDGIREILGVDDESDRIINHYHGDWTE